MKPSPNSLVPLLVRLGALASMVVGGLVLTGWALDIAALKSVWPGWVSMKPNTALAFILTGIALLASAFSLATPNSGPSPAGPRLPGFLSRVARICGLLAGAIGLVSLAEYAFGWNPGFDQWLFPEPAGTVGTSNPGRMAPETAGCFALLAAAFWLTSGPHKNRWASLVSAMLGLLVMTLALAAMLCYFTPTLGAFGWWGLTIMAVPTAATFAVLGLAIMLITWHEGVWSWAINKTATAAFVIGMALFVIIGLNSSRSVVRLNETNRSITHTEQVLQTVSAIQATVAQAQTHTRGYLITGNEGFLASRVADAAGCNRAMHTLRQLIADDPGLQPRTIRLEAQVKEALQWFQQVIDASRAGMTDATRRQMVEHGETLMESLRSAFEGIEHAEGRLLQQHEREAESVARFAYWVISAGTLASLVIFLGALVGLNRAEAERKRTEAALREREEQFRAMFQLASIGMAQADVRTGRWLRVNEKLCEITGYSVDEMLKLSVSEITLPEDRARDWEAFQRVVRGEAPDYRLEKRYVRKDGTPVWVNVNMTVLRAADGLTARTMATIEDITARRQAEAALRESEQKYRELVEHANSIILRWTRDGKITFLNEYGQKFFGYPEAEIVGRHVVGTIVPAGESHRRDLRGMMEQIGAHPEAFEQNISENMLRNGEKVWMAWANKLVLDAQGQVKEILSVGSDITARHQAEAALKQSEERYRLLFEQAPDIIFGLAPTGAFTSLNHAFETITGWPPAQWLQRPFQELIHPDDQARARARFLEVLRGAERVPSIELRVRTATGGFRDVEITGFSSEFSGGGIEMQGIGRDITERKRAEAEAERLAAIVESSGDAIIGQDLRGVITSWNRGAEKIFGYDAAEMVGQPGARWISPGQQAEAADILDTVGRGEAVKRVETVRTAKDGRTIEVSITVSPIKSAAGQIVGASNVARDISGRHRAEQTLRENVERYRLLFDHNPLPMWLYDLETLRFLAVNESAVQNYGYTREEFLGMTIEQIRPPEDIPMLLKAVAEVGATSRSTIASRHRRKDGTVIQVEIIVRALVLAGRHVGLVLAADITEKKLLEEKFLHAQRLESIGMLAAGIAHDLNNVLAPIVFATPMLRDSLSTPRDLKILDTLERSAGRGTGLVKQILGFVHSTTGDFRSTQVKHLARDIVSLIEETFPKSIRLEHEIPSDLWQVQGNPTQIHQVLLNLCVNARDAMPQGGTLSITATNRRLDEQQARSLPGARPGAWLVLEIADTGAGIPPDVLAHIWDPFFTTKGLGKGTGLGLSTVRGLVANHGGFVTLDTQPGHGTTFRVFLPAIESEAPPHRSASPRDIPDGRGELILVVDDDAAIRDIIAANLGDHGYRVVSCVDGVEAIARFDTHPRDISLVITDVDMPRLGGVALARALLQLHPDIRLVAMSGLSRNETGGSDIPEIRKLAHAFLLKPFTPEDLLGTVHRLLHPPEKI